MSCVAWMWGYSLDEFSEVGIAFNGSVVLLKNYQFSDRNRPVVKRNVAKSRVMSRELQRRRNQPHEVNEQGIEEPKEGTNQLNEINKQIIEQLKKNYRWAAESFDSVYERVAKVELEQRLKSCKWVKELKSASKRKLRLTTTQQSRLDPCHAPTDEVSRVAADLPPKKQAKLSSTTPYVETDKVYCIKPPRNQYQWLIKSRL